jgi:hypothetical protein
LFCFFSLLICSKNLTTHILKLVCSCPVVAISFFFMLGFYSCSVHRFPVGNSGYKPHWWLQAVHALSQSIQLSGQGKMYTIWTYIWYIYVIHNRNSFLFRLLPHYMFQPLRAIFRWNKCININSVFVKTIALYLIYPLLHVLLSIYFRLF